jgi:glutamyl-tRNA synthetase
MTIRPVRTRFAPSPTGFQHIGGFRTAFFAYLLAKNLGGKFILRIEDTDQERSVPTAVRFILEEFKWLGIVPDEGPSHEELKAIGEYWEGAPVLGGAFGPYTQSLRKEKYKAAAELLIQKGCAYRCDCTSEMLEQERNEQMARKEPPGYSGYCRTRNVSADSKHVVRFKMPPKVSVTLDDAVKGKVVWDTVPMKDPVLLKSDGLPTYHLAVVVDDTDMQITHVLRGTEWLSSAPLHLMLYEAFGYEPPIFAHLPTVNGADGKKLSKRTGAKSSRDFRNEGYLPDAVLNYTSLVGWSPGEAANNQEIFTREELIQRFSLNGLNPASGIFDPHKLEWMNGMYIRSMSKEAFNAVAIPLIEVRGFKVDKERWALIAQHVQERVKVLNEIPEMVEFLFTDTITRDLDAMLGKGIDKPKAKEICEKAYATIAALPEYTIQSTDTALRALAETLGLKVGAVFMVLRIAVTGKKITPPLFESLVALGKEATLARLREVTGLL